MTSIKAAMAKVVDSIRSPVPGAPEAEWIAAPETTEQLTAVLQQASDHQLKVLVWGGGTHQGYGYRIDPDIVVSTSRLNRMIDWEPDDLTVVVEGGVRLEMIEEMLAERRQTTALPEIAGEATVGGVVAAGISGYRRARYGPTRDRLLEVTVVTGDGRLVRGGGRVVKNVTGYDLPRLMAGSLGALGVIISVCLKLWPLAERSVTVGVDDPERAWSVLYRPLAVLEVDGRARAYLNGTPAAVEAQAGKLGGTVSPGLDWPRSPSEPVRWSLRIPPALTRQAVEKVADLAPFSGPEPRHTRAVNPGFAVPGGTPQANPGFEARDTRGSGPQYVAQFGVGEVGFGCENLEAVADLRQWAEGQGGSLVLVEGPPEVYQTIDPWGTPPTGLELQRRLVKAFDPQRVLNPGRLPGGI